LKSQIPSNGFCVRARLAQNPGYPGLPDSGDACDWAFSARLALNSAMFVYVDAYLSTYVISRNSIGNDNPKNNATLSAMKIAEAYFYDQIETSAYAGFFASHLGGAISQSIYHSDKKYAWSLIKNAWFDKRVRRAMVARQFIKFIWKSLFRFGK
jgi:hypothetical protein